MTPGEFRLRVCYRKSGRLRWLSHLEIVHTLERMIRRADLPYAITQGFSPHLKAAFGPALPVGTAGDNEYFDVWLTRYTDADEILRSLVAAAPSDLAPHEARFIADRAPALTAAMTIALYDVDVIMEGIDARTVHDAIAKVVSAGELKVEHKGKTKVFDLARSLPEGARVGDVDGGVRIAITVRMGPQGSLRPESLVRTALADIGLAAPVVRTTRRDTFIEEDGVWSRPM